MKKYKINSILKYLSCVIVAVLIILLGNFISNICNIYNTNIHITSEPEYLRTECDFTNKEITNKNNQKLRGDIAQFIFANQCTKNNKKSREEIIKFVDSIPDNELDSLNIKSIDNLNIFNLGKFSDIGSGNGVLLKFNGDNHFIEKNTQPVIVWGVKYNGSENYD